jgi:hypothetical protein
VGAAVALTGPAVAVGVGVGVGVGGGVENAGERDVAGDADPFDVGPLEHATRVANANPSAAARTPPTRLRTRSRPGCYELTTVPDGRKELP